MKIAIVGDVHWGARNNANYFLRRSKSFFSNVFFPYMLDNCIDWFIQVGDLLESRKTVGLMAHNALRTHMLEASEKHGIAGVYLAGNHDILHNNTSTWNWLDELIPPRQYPLSHVIGKAFTMNLGGLDIDIIPWINSDNEEETMEFIKNSKSKVCMAHLDINGFEMQKGVTCVNGFDRKVFKDYQIVFSGHYHGYQEEDNIVYVGTQVQFNWSDYNIKKGFIVLDTDTLEFEYIENPSNSFQKIIYDDKTNDYNDLDVTDYTDCFVKVIVNTKTDDKMFDTLIDRLNAVAYEVDPVDVRQLDIGDDDPNMQVDDSFTILLHTVDDMDTRLDRASIKSKISVIHSEAEEEMLV